MVETPTSQIDEDAVLKEVWNTKEVAAKTEVTDQQIQSINNGLTLAKIFNSKLLSSHINQFMILQKSRNRKSMEEFVAVVKAKRDDFVNKVKDGFGNMLG